jgi:dual specificity tyrosine-phosphorylation-regulated kinase 1
LRGGDRLTAAQQQRREQQRRQLEAAAADLTNGGRDDPTTAHIKVRPGERWHGGRYEINRAVGKGSFGTVVDAWDLCTGTSVAIKVIRNRSAFTRQARREVAMLERLNTHAPGATPKLLKVFTHANHTCLVLERCEMDLYEAIKSTDFRGIGLRTVRRIGRELCESLAVLAKAPLQIIHADIKPENVMLSGADGTARLIDFGSAYVDGEQKGKFYVQSRYYRAPEVVLGLPYDNKIDVFSLGCVLYELSTGAPLFPSKTTAHQAYLIAAAMGPFPAHMVAGARAKLWDPATGVPTDPISAARISDRRRRSVREQLRANGAPLGLVTGVGEADQFADLVTRMVEVDPSKRISAETCLTHPFFRPSAPSPMGIPVSNPAMAAMAAMAAAMEASAPMQPAVVNRTPVVNMDVDLDVVGDELHDCMLIEAETEGDAVPIDATAASLSEVLSSDHVFAAMPPVTVPSLALMNHTVPRAPCYNSLAIRRNMSG